MTDLVIKGINNRKLNIKVCPHCKSEEIVKYGFYKGEQRYRCNHCRKTFNPYTGTIFNWSHYKEKWGDFINTMSMEMSLREAGSAIGIHYSTLFYWRHKVMDILSQGNNDKLNGVIEMMKLDLNYIDKYRNIKLNQADDFFEENEQVRKDIVHLTFLFKRKNRLNTYVYRDNTRAAEFINNISGEIDMKSIICLNVNYPFRFPLLHHKFRVFDISGKKGNRKFYYNAENVKKLLTGFKSWMMKFRGVSSKYLNKYAAFYKTHHVFNNMEFIILSFISENIKTNNSLASRGDVLI